jgi:hypothetical protein
MGLFSNLLNTFLEYFLSFSPTSIKVAEILLTIFLVHHSLRAVYIYILIKRLPLPLTLLPFIPLVLIFWSLVKIWIRNADCKRSFCVRCLIFWSVLKIVIVNRILFILQITIRIQHNPLIITSISIIFYLPSHLSVPLFILTLILVGVSWMSKSFLICNKLILHILLLILYMKLFGLVCNFVLL